VTRKKQRTCEAKTLRRMVKGVTLPQSVQLVKAMSDTFAFLDLLKRYGFQYGEVVTGYCPSDHGPEGYYSVLKNNIPAGKIPFNCCGIYIEEVRVVNKTLQEIVAARVVEQNQVPVTQYKLTCGYLPHEEQCEYQGNCGGCENQSKIKKHCLADISTQDNADRLMAPAKGVSMRKLLKCVVQVRNVGGMGETKRRN